MSEQSTMQTIRFHQYGGPEQLALERTPRPEVKSGTVLVRVKASSVNPIDWKLRSGAFQQFMPVQFPYTPGVEFAGTVEETGPGVTGFEKGKPVFASGGSTNAEFVLAPADSLAPMPRNLTFEQAASVPIGGLTAWRGLFETADLQPGQRILIQGAAGGVGYLAVQLARWKGAHVAGTASAANLEFIRSLGAEEAIDYGSTRFETALRDMDVVLDTVGGEVQVRSLQVLRPGGIYVSVAGMPPQEEAQKRGVRAAGLFGPADPVRTQEIMRRLTELIETGAIKVEVTKVFPLAETAQAHAFSQQGHGRGRVVLHVAD